jgi:hypothetical protein
VSESMFSDGGDLAAEVDWQAGVLPGTTSNADPWRSGVAGSAGVSLGTGTGRLGSVPLETTDMGADGINAVLSWINTPFTSPMNKQDVFLLVGTILVAIVVWNFVLYHIRIAAETI